MSRFARRFRLFQILGSVGIGLLLLTLAACASSSSKTATTTPVVTVAVSPKTASVIEGKTQTFAATVTGTTNTAVTWTVTESNGGTVDSTGKYTAPNAAGSFHVVATSQASSTVSDTATVTVTAPPPVPTFTSVPPTPATEGLEYDYDVVATDTLGSAMTYALTSAPTGATISSGSISWTPTSAESRVSNSFTVTVTSAAGGTNTQSWTVTPNGTIYGSAIDTYWTAAGGTKSPEDLSGEQFQALISYADGTYQWIYAKGNSNGTFTIPNVPAGNFWLYAFNQWYWTNSSTFDLGSDYSGQNMDNLNWYGTAQLNLSLTGLDSLPNDWSWLETVDANSANCGWDYSNLQIAPGTTTYNSTDPSTYVNLNCPIAAGDSAFIIQMEPATGTNLDITDYYWADTPGAALALPNTFTAPVGSATPVTATLVNNSQSFDVKVGNWTAAFNLSAAPVSSAPVSGNATPGIDVGGFQVGVQPFVSDRATSSGSTSSGWNDEGPSSATYLWAAYEEGMVLGNTDGTMQDAGAIQYNNPFPASWLQVYGAYADYQTGDFNNDTVYNMYATTVPQTGGFAPIMTPIQNPVLNGANGGSLFASGLTSDVNAVTLSWTAPATGSAVGYEIEYWGCGGGYLYTSSTSVTVPAVLLNPGCSYIFQISAVEDSRANFNNSPNRTGYPQALVDVVSAPIAITSLNGGGDDAVRKAIAKIANGNVVRNKNGAFLVTAKGNKPLDIRAKMLARFGQHSAKKSKTGSVAK